MLALVTLAHAHPAALPHLHADEPASLGLLAFWGVAGVAWLAWTMRSLPAR